MAGIAAGAKPRGKHHHGDLRRALVRAGLDLLEERGIEALTVRGLARRVRVSHAAPAYHFPDKLALLAAVAAEAYRRFRAALEAAAQEAARPTERLGRIGMAYVRFALDHPATFRLMFGRELASCSDAPLDLREASSSAYGVLEAAVADAVGQPSPIDALAAWSLVHGAVMLYLDGPVRNRLPAEDPRGAFEQAMEAILGGGLERHGKTSRARRARRKPAAARRES